MEEQVGYWTIPAPLMRVETFTLAGYTTSTTGIATTGAHQTTSGGDYDAFLVKFNSSGVRQWGTYYGGTGYDDGLFLRH